MKNTVSRALIALIVVGGAVSANADVLLDTYAGDAPGFQANGWIVATWQYMSRPFSVTGSYTLDSIELPLGNFNDNTGVYDVSICADNAGVPGTVLESFAVNVTTGNGVVSSYLLNSALNPLLTTGTYYVTATTTDANLNGGWGWNNANNTGDQQFSTDGGGTWNNFNSTDVAVRVMGTSTTVPEPASMAVLGLGALALVRRRRTAK
ncbi:MAG: PEP-CTERM sorting domain-containing protein [Armatimonadetes bacterium]|nr:PEP-CTERM sorting domain-containing protein [Armatimonadota bacterium]MBS1728182.1 PEP-CTERM sorting domain-containing protein [Armatimonadota bacterium]